MGHEVKHYRYPVQAISPSPFMCWHAFEGMTQVETRTAYDFILKINYMAV